MLKRGLKIFSKSNYKVITIATKPAATGAINAINARTQCTLVCQEDGVREITLNEAKTRNALSMPMMESILEELTKDLNDEALRCIVLASSGPVWSAGHNLKELSKDNNAGHEIFSKLTEIILCMHKAPVPIIAKVNGLAAAAGCQLVASCDMVVCSDKSSFSTPGANYGIFCSTPGVAIARVMPRLKASHMVMTGLPMNAQNAFIAGLASVVVPESELDAEVDKITCAIKEKSRAVIALGKRFYYKQLNMNIKEAYTAGAEIMAKNIGLPDGQEGLKCFAEKRKPNWSHKDGN